MKNLEGIIKSQSDPLNYKAFELENKLKIIFVEDKDTKKSCAVMNVGRGSLSDPKTHEGLAHFLEHMLFMGSEKFPKPDHYRNFINQNGGNCNAMTTLTNTIFYHSIVKKSLMESLDILAQFFLSPLMDQNYIDKEMKAVASEFQKSYNADGWKEFQILRTISDPESIFNKFLCGNEDTLRKDDIYEQLKRYHKECYSSNIMTLSIYHDDIASIQDEVCALFKDIVNKNVPEFNYLEKPFPYGKSHTSKLVEYKSVKKEKKLSFMWFLKPMQKHFKNPPLKLLSHLIGHESEGSIHSILMEENLIYSISAYGWNIDNYISQFNISCVLTKKGYENVPRIVEVISSYINMLKKGIPEWVFNELQHTNDFEFRYQSKSKALTKSMKICENLSGFPIEYCNKLGYVQEKFQPELISSILNNLNSENMIMWMANNEFENLVELEPIYQSGYNLKDIDETVIDKFNNPTLSEKDLKKIQLPPQNYFIPENFDLVEKDNAFAKYPKQILEEESRSGDLYIKQDIEFNLPKAVLIYRIYTNTSGFFSNVDKLLMKNIWILLLKKKLKKFTYLADMGKMSFHLNNNLKGIVLEINGFTNKMEVFLEKLSEKMKDFMMKTDEEWLRKEFENMKKKKLIDYDKELKKEVFRQVLASRSYLFLTNCYSTEVKIENLKNLTFETFSSFCKNFLNQFYYEAFFSGNITKEQSLKYNQTFMKNLKKPGFTTLEKNKIVTNRVIKLNKKSTKVILHNMDDENEKNDVILLNYQLKQDPSKELIMRVLDKYFSTPFFEELRTEKQLGYVVFSLFQSFSGVFSFQFLIQSNVTTSMHCVGHINQFLKKHRDLIKDLDDKVFEDFKESIIKNILGPYNNLNEEANFYYGKISDNTYEFDWKSKVTDLMAKITKQDLIDLYNQIFFDKKKLLEYHKVCKQNIKQNKDIFEYRELFQDEKIVLIECENDLKKKSALYLDLELKK